MSETEAKAQGQKPKVSILAIVSLLLSILGICLLVLILDGFGIYSFIGRSKMPFYLRPLYVYGHLVSGLMVIAGIAAGIFAIKEIRNKRRILKGGQFAISGVLIGVVFLVFWVWHSPGSPFTARKRCAANLRALGTCMLIYTTGDYPMPTDKWCDLLIEYNEVHKSIFRCKGAPEGPCNYAMNKNVEKLGARCPPDMVLLFETSPGWNQAGGPEILTTENHYGEGCNVLNVLFIDSHAEFIRTEDLNDLKWTAEQND